MNRGIAFIIAFFFLLALVLIASGIINISSYNGISRQQIVSRQDDTDQLTEPKIGKTGNPTADMKKLFSLRYGKNQNDIDVTIESQDPNHVRGKLSVYDNGAELPREGNNGIFLAAYENGEWILLYEGVGPIVCNELKPYNFPEEMISDCEPEPQKLIEPKNGRSYFDGNN